MPQPAAPSGISTFDALEVRTHGDGKALAADAAWLAAKHLRETLDQQATATVILATGQSQLAMLDQLVELGGIDWGRITCFHMDEYLGLPKDHPASFQRYLHERVERRIGARAFHYLNGETMQPIAECERYGALLKAQPIDLCFLGVGNNGHLAFNDPPVADFDDPYAVKIVKLDDISRRQQVSQGHFPSVEAMPHYALTITLPTLRLARRLLCLASGSHKASVVKSLLLGPITPQCPASILRRSAQATLLLDKEAAALLK